MNEETILKYEKGKEMYLNGISTIKISKILNISRSRFSTWLKNEGVNVSVCPQRNKINENIFKIINTEEKGYWLGFLYADGYVTHDNRWGAELGYEDCNHLQNLLNAFGYNGDLKTRERNGVVSCSFTINNKQMTSSLISNGVVPNKTYCLEFPNVDIVSKNLLSHFIRGYFDGDGCVHYSEGEYFHKERGKYYNQYCFACIFVGNENFLNSIK